jgi:hypothetical protein
VPKRSSVVGGGCATDLHGEKGGGCSDLISPASTQCPALSPSPSCLTSREASSRLECFGMQYGFPAQAPAPPQAVPYSESRPHSPEQAALLTKLTFQEAVGGLAPPATALASRARPSLRVAAGLVLPRCCRSFFQSVQDIFQQPQATRRQQRPRRCQVDSATLRGELSPLLQVAGAARRGSSGRCEQAGSSASCCRTAGPEPFRGGGRCCGGGEG